MDVGTLNIQLMSDLSKLRDDMQSAKRITGDAMGSIDASMASVTATIEAMTKAEKERSSVFARTLAETKRLLGITKAASEETAKSLEDLKIDPDALKVPSAAYESLKTWQEKSAYALGAGVTIGMDKAKSAWESFKSFTEHQVVIWGIALATGIAAGVLGAVYLAYKSISFAIGLLTGESYKSANIDALTSMNKEVKDLQESLPLTAVGASALNEALKAQGVGAAAYATTINSVASAVRSNGDELDRLGVKYKDQNGNILATDSILKNASEVLSSYAEGWDRTQAAQAIGMGTEKQIQDALSITAEKVQVAKDRLIDYGLIIGAGTQEAVTRYTDSMRAFERESDLTSQGFKRAIADNIMPVLTELSDFFRDGFPFAVMAFRYSLATVTSLLYGLKTVAYIVSESVIGSISAIGSVIGGLASASVKMAKGDFTGAKNELVKGWDDAKNRLGGIGDNIVEQARRNSAAMALAWGADSLGANATEDAIKKVGKTWREAQKEDEDAYNAALSAAEKYLESLRIEVAQIGLNSDQIKAMTAGREAAKAPTEELRQQIMDEVLALTIAKKAWEDKVEAEKQAAELQKKFTDAATGTWDQVRALEAEIATYGLLTSAVTDLAIVKVKAQLSSAELTDAETVALESQVAALERLRGLQATKEGLDSIKEFDKYMDPAKAQSYGDAIKGAFGSAGESIVKMTKAFNDYTRVQAQNAKQQESLKRAKDAGIDVDERQAALNMKVAHDQIASYADMAAAAQGFFEKGSTGYKVLGDISKAFHMIEMAMAIQSMITNVMAAETKTEANIASIPPAIAAGGAEMFAQSGWGGFIGVAAMLAVMAALGFAGGGGGGSAPSLSAQRQASQGTGTVLGDASAKSESLSKTNEDLKKNSDLTLPLTQGMLAHLQNIDSEMAGVAQIIMRTAGVSNVEMGIHQGTSNTMQNLVNGWGDQNANNTNKLFGKLYGGSAGAHLTNQLVNLALDVSKYDKVLGGLFGHSSQNVTDSGLSITGTLGNVGQGQGISQYANVHSESSSFWGLSSSSSDSTVRGAVDATISDQIGKMFKNISDTVLLAANSFTSDTSGIARKLADYIVNIPNLSLQGLSGDKLQEALNNVFSAFSDKLAEQIIPGMQEFQQVGEGYFQTVVRIASGIEQAKFALEKFGVTAINFKDIVNKQGDVALEITRQSLLQKEKISDAVYTQQKIMQAVQVQVPVEVHTQALEMVTDPEYGQYWTGQFIDVVTQGFQTVTKYVAGSITTMVKDVQYSGIGDILKNFTGSFEELVTLYGQLVDERRQMIGTGLGSNLSASTIVGAGGLSELNNGVAAFKDKYFSVTEKLAIDTKDMTDLFTRLGVALPQDRDQFKALAQGIDTTTEAGQKYQGQLLAEAGAFSDLMDERESAMSELKSQYDGQSSALNDTIDNLKSFRQGIEDFNKSLISGSLSVLTPMQKLAAAQAQYESTLALARSGDQDARGKLTSDASAFLTQDQIVNASSAAYVAANAKVQSDLASLSQLAGTQITDAQKQLDKLDLQINALTTLNSTSVDIHQAIIDLNASFGGAPGDVMYAGGSNHFNELTGATIDGSHANGLYSVPFDGYRAELHKGERVLTAFEARNYSSQSNVAADALVAEIKSLRDEVKALRQDQAEHTGAVIQSNYDANNRAADKIVDGTDKSSKNAAWADKAQAQVKVA